jgi:hypothetical protein
LVLLAPVSAQAAPPWAALIPFRRIEADPKKTYELTESQGPWMIMAASFAGPTAEEQAQDLCLELRQRFQLEAFTFKQDFDFSQPTEGLGFNKFGGPKKMRYATNTKFEEIAVLVGNYQSVEDPAVEKTLKDLKYARPQVFEVDYKKNSSQRFAGLRAIYRYVSPDPARKQKGPMGSAFVTRNPLLPEEYFTAKGLEPFLVEINKDLPYSLLSNPRRYTVRVASFRGVDTMKPAEFEKLTSQRRSLAKIDEAAVKASKLCAALRAKGVEAYEFHDRTESIVTIGSFDEVGQPRADGKTEINPGVYRIMQEYGPIREALPGTNVAGLHARSLNGIPFDPQPVPVEVPRESVAAAYNRSNSSLR